MDLIAVATTTSGIEASIMPSGRIAHSQFKIPIKLGDSTVCSFTKQSGTAELLRQASLIIWDEVALTKRQAVEALDRTLQDVMGCTDPFGGKVMLFGGDFRQVLPVVVHEYLLRIGNGTKETFNDDYVQLPDGILIETPLEDISINTLIDHFLNSIMPNGLHPHELTIKKNCPVILLRNLDPHNGLCNGTRLIVRGFQNNVIDAEIVNSQHEGKRVFIPRILMSPSENLSLPFEFKRKQFPI
ncbi:hypothetical protein SETIT_2G239300v2 [Setaria italica]|uniref:ATP-dependent DNA helicase n=1 Tax=Setaria italica TaxID=4555 RepID=A0A368Q2F5_SETIT|nr:hypothetical protein SETIT_2G239300v2 [Setaria italica]